MWKKIQTDDGVFWRDDLTDEQIAGQYPEKNAYVVETREDKPGIWEMDGITLADAIDEKVREVDATTERLIKKGFEFDGYHFSMSEAAQINWAGLRGLWKDAPEEIEGYRIPAEENGRKKMYTLSSATIQPFLSAVFDHKEGLLQSGYQIAEEIYALETIADIMNYNDTREEIK